jgi:hypothetical protein
MYHVFFAASRVAAGKDAKVAVLNGCWYRLASARLARGVGSREPMLFWSSQRLWAVSVVDLDCSNSQQQQEQQQQQQWPLGKQPATLLFVMDALAVAQPPAEDDMLIREGDWVVFDEHGDKKSLVIIKRKG